MEQSGKVPITEPIIKYVLPRGTIIFRVENFSMHSPPYLFYAYFTGNFRESYMINKQAWASRCATNINEQTRVRFMRTIRDIELMDMSMNNYTYNDPTNEDLAAVDKLITIATERMNEEDLTCFVDALKTVYAIEHDTNNQCPTMADYTVASFVYSHLDIGGWVRMSREEDDPFAVIMDEVMLVRSVYENDLELIEEDTCSILDSGAPPPSFLVNGEDEDFEQPELYIKKAVIRKKGKQSTLSIDSIHDRNDGLHDMTKQSLSNCLHCSHPCSIYENGIKERPFCSVTCQSLNRCINK